MTRLSVVVPAYNEAGVIGLFHDRILAVLARLELTWELIYIDDGSTDRTAKIIEQYCEADQRVKLLCLSRNFGHQAAITAGMDHAAGDAIVVIDADLQDPPELIPQLVKKWQDGFDVVYARRISRQGESRTKKLSACIYYRLLHRLTDVKIPVDVGDFRLIDARVAKALAGMGEHSRYVRGLISWLGFKQTSVEFIRAPREAGETKYPFNKMLTLAINGITAFSYKPLRLGIFFGILLSVCSFLFLLFILIARLFDLVVMQPGYASLMCIILFSFGILLTMLGIIGEYIGRIFEEVKNRPLYIVSDKSGHLKQSVRPLHTFTGKKLSDKK